MAAFRSGAGKRAYGTRAGVPDEPESVVRIERRGGGVVGVVLDRPDVRNAFDAQLIRTLTQTFAALGSDTAVRAIVLAGSGKSFCGGADIGWMRAAVDLSVDENVRDAERMAEMFAAIDSCPKPVIGRVHGAAFGGGAGLAAVCDIVVCSTETIFGFTETKLGIIPAVIAPFVLAKIGLSAARALFLSGERFTAERAQRIGLIHEIVPFDDLDRRIEALEIEFATSGPGAMAAIKELLPQVARASIAENRALTTHAIAAQRTTAEGQEGLRAFLERRPPVWVAK